VTRRHSNNPQGPTAHSVEIPGREDILNALTEEGVPMPAERLGESLGVEGDEAR